MTTTAIAMMILICGVVWGGFAALRWHESASDAELAAGAAQPAIAPPVEAAAEPEALSQAPQEPAAIAAATEPRVAVAINATPWAIVAVDGEVLGETPIASVELSAGPHTFTAQMPDGSVREKTVEIGADSRRIVFE